MPYIIFLNGFLVLIWELIICRGEEIYPIIMVVVFSCCYAGWRPFSHPFAWLKLDVPVILAVTYIKLDLDTGLVLGIPTDFLKSQSAPCWRSATPHSLSTAIPWSGISSGKTPNLYTCSLMPPSNSCFLQGPLWSFQELQAEDCAQHQCSWGSAEE